MSATVKCDFTKLKSQHQSIADTLTFSVIYECRTDYLSYFVHFLVWPTTKLWKFWKLRKF